MRKLISILILSLLPWLGFGQQIFRFPAVCFPSSDVEEQLKKKQLQIVLEILESYRAGVIRTFIARDKEGDYLIFDQYESGLSCLIFVGKESRVGPAFM